MRLSSRLLRCQSAALGPRGEYLAVVGGVGSIQLFRTVEGIQVAAVHLQTRIHALQLGPRRLLAVLRHDRIVEILDLRAGKRVSVLEGHRGRVTRAIFTPDGRLVITGCTEGIVRIFETHGGTLMRKLIAHDGCISALAVDPGGRLLTSADLGGRCYLWRLPGGQGVRNLSYGDRIRSAAFAPDGRLLAFCGFSTVRVTVVGSGQPLWTFHPGSEVTCVAFGPRRRVVGTGDAAGAVRLWSLTTGKLVETYSRPGRRIETLVIRRSTIVASLHERGREGEEIDSWDSWRRIGTDS